MSAPFFKYGLFGSEASLIVAVFIGIGFGFFLERAGFGSARKLAAQFYFTDMTVLKVMFTAIVTAMVGVYYLSVFGVLDLSLVYLTPTYLAPQVAGGLILGIGFVVGGYCPGTACVSASTGRYDGWIYVGGLFVGILFFGEVFHWVEKLYSSTPLGQVTLPQLLHLPYGFLVFLVCVIAVGAFAAAEWGEKKMAAKKEGE